MSRKIHNWIVNKISIVLDISRHICGITWKDASIYIYIYIYIYNREREIKSENTFLTLKKTLDKCRKAIWGLYKTFSPRTANEVKLGYVTKWHIHIFIYTHTHTYICIYIYIYIYKCIYCECQKYIDF